ncbi:MAG TPA: hypothetical protein VFW94_23585 [Candidatus Acidoferrales bacterium]|nr:hypothetical protein [Candidatus Acidoferrales bacterium]
MAITYKEVPGSATSTIMVYLDQKLAGRILHTHCGWVYFPRGRRVGGQEFATLEACKRSLEHPEATTPQDVHAQRAAKIRELLEDSPAVEENGYEIPATPERYLCIERQSGDAVWAYTDDTLAGLARSIDESETTADDYEAIDLDTDQSFNVEMSVSAFYSHGEPSRVEIHPTAPPPAPSPLADTRLLAKVREALDYAQKLIPTARRYFPKSIRNSDTFQLENACATLGSAIRAIETAPMPEGTATDGTTAIKLSSVELAAVLTGLRMYQKHGIDAEMLDIATNAGEFQPLDNVDIDDLCERLNCGDGAEDEDGPYLPLTDPRRCDDCTHPKHVGKDCPYCKPGDHCHPHPKDSKESGWKYL